MTTPSVPIGIGSPNVLTVPVSRGQSTFDLTQVTGAYLRVLTPSGTQTTWAASVVSQTVSTLSVLHSFVPTDVTEPGMYQIAAVLQLGGGEIPCGSRPMKATNFP